MSKTRYYQGASWLAVSLALSVVAAPAFAQQGAATVAQVNAQQEDIDRCYAEAAEDEAKLAACDEKANAVTAVVSTGSRIRGLPEDAALPVEVLGREQLLDRGAPNIADLLKQMTESSSMAGDGNRGATGYGDAQISLRGMGSGRTLALVNGRRLGDMVSESGFTSGNSQDISSVPMGALQQVEILKDGGTTTYGADAVAGVINFITRRDLNGTEVTYSHRFIDDTSGFDDLSVLWGRRNDAGNILLSFQYEHRAPLKNSERVFSLQEPFAGGRKVFLAGGVTPNWQTATSAGQFAFQLPLSASGAFPAGTVIPSANGFASITPIGSNFGTPGILSYQEQLLGQFLAQTGPVPPLVAGSSLLATHIQNNLFQPIGAGPGGAGRLRDQGCDELGGAKGFDIINSPACFQNYAYALNQINELSHYNFFGDANLRLNDKVQYHTEFSFRLQRSDVLLGPSGTNFGYQGYASAGTNPACEPLPSTAPSRSSNPDAGRECTRSQASNFAGTGIGSTAFNSAATAWSTPGYNPAVADYAGRFYNLAGTARGLTGLQYTALTGITLPAAAGPPVGAYTVAGSPGSLNEFGQALTGGRVSHYAGQWTPFGLGGNPAFEDGNQHAQVDNYGFRTVQQLKVDLGKVFGMTVDVDVSGTYQRDITLYQDSGILADRLQRALNGFATDLDDPDGDTCTFEETRGPRTYSSVPDPDGAGPNFGINADPDGTGPLTGTTVQGVGYTVGAGGGANVYNANRTGFTPGASTGTDPDGTGPLTSGSQAWAGNGCYFFNPFSTATAFNPFQEITAPLATATSMGGHRAGRLAPGGDASVPDYQGYSPGYGLANSPGIARWLYEDRSRRLQSDNVYFDIAFNGDFAGLSLPGGPLGWAAGAQWRYVRREVSFDRLSDRAANPCSFRTSTGDPVFQGSISGTAANSQLRREDSSTCSAQSNGPWADSYGGNNDLRQTRTVSLFGEVAMPLTDRVTSQIAYRWEQENRNSRSSEGVGIFSGSMKWQLTPNFSLRGSAGDTFDPTDVPNAGFNRSTGNCIGSVDTAGSSINENTECYTVNNTAIGPETGFNYNVGMIWQTPDRRVFTSLDYFNITVEGTPSGVNATQIARALTGIINGNMPVDSPIDCSSAAAQTLFGQINDGLDVGNGSRAVVGYRDLSGAVDTTGCRPGTTLRGDTGTGDALSIAVPNQINANQLRASGIDGRISYTHPDEFLGGRVSVGIDATYNINRFNEGAILFGVQLAQPELLLGTNTGGLTYAVWRGNLTLNYLRGNHAFTWFSNATSSYRSPTVQPIFPNNPGGVPYFNFNPEASLRGLCPSALVPTVGGGANPSILGPSGVGEGNYNPGCNVPSLEAFRFKSTVVSTLNYRYNMPEQRASVALTVENLFDRDPEYFNTGTGYDTSGLVNPYGRNYKITLTKTF